MASKEVNGVNVDGLSQTIDAVNANPTVAKFRLQVGNQWVHGAHSRSTVNEFYGAGQNFRRPKSFTLDADEPPVLLGNDIGPNAGEYLLAALAACVTSALVYHAAARGVIIEEIESKVEGDIDLRGFLGVDKNVRNGFQNISMKFKIRADVSDEQLEELAQLGPAFSPVLDSLTKGVPINVQAQRMESKKASGSA